MCIFPTITYQSPTGWGTRNTTTHDAPEQQRSRFSRLFHLYRLHVQKSVMYEIFPDGFVQHEFGFPNAFIEYMILARAHQRKINTVQTNLCAKRAAPR